jgi:hypothetical protein
MFESLPLRYRVLVWVGGLVTCAAGGAWLAASTPLPLLWRAGTFVGAAVGILLVLGFLHLMHPERAPQRDGRRPPPRT